MYCDNMTTAETQARLDAGQIVRFEKPAAVMLTASKGRREIVKAAGLDWVLLKNNFDEDAVNRDKSLIDNVGKATEYCEDLAFQKLKAVKDYFVNAAVICADTVVFNKKLLEKPKTEAEVYEMIRGLNGSRHQVITGVSIYDCRIGQTTHEDGAIDKALQARHSAGYHYPRPQVSSDCRMLTFACVSEVLLSGVTDDKIAEMIRRENPYACSGGYTIDGLLSPHFTVLSGGRDNVIGLPLKEILRKL